MRAWARAGRAGLLISMACLAMPGAAFGAPRLERVGDFTAPAYVTAPAGDPRLFVVEQGGKVRIVGKNGVVRPDPFLDVSADISAGGERGLLSIAFPPDYAQSGLFYAYVTARAPAGQIQVREYRRSADPFRADPATGRVVIAQDHGQFSNHNGGQLQFGPDGLLYAGLGDGGNRDDSPQQSGQRLNTLLGKLLRIDPRAAGGRPYTVPPDNPYAAVAGDVRREIWALGLRNPWRFSFDRLGGDLVIADVGQDRREEIDAAARATGLGRGANYGWRCFEGKIRTPAQGGGNLCTDAELPAGAVAPVHDRDHTADKVCSITGGYVVRDPGLPSLAGRYVYGDFCDTGLRSLALGAPAQDGPVGLSVANLSSFGEDACGRVYVMSLSGPVWRLQDGAATPCELAEPGAAVAPSAPLDRSAPVLRVSAGKRPRFSRQGRLRLKLRCDEPCRVIAGGRLARKWRVGPGSREVPAGRSAQLSIRLSRRGRRGLRRLTRRAMLRLAVTATDAAGNATTVNRRLRLRLRAGGRAGGAVQGSSKPSGNGSSGSSRY